MLFSSFLFSQILASVTLICDLVSWQFKERNKILSCFIIGSAFYGAHFLILGAWTGAALAALAVARFVVAIKKPGNKRFLYFFLTLTILITAATYQSWVSLLAGLGTFLGTIGSFQEKDRGLRLFLMVATASWIAHNIIVWTPVGILLESGFLVSNLIGYWRYYRK